MCANTVTPNSAEMFQVPAFSSVALARMSCPLLAPPSQNDATVTGLLPSELAVNENLEN